MAEIPDVKKPEAMCMTCRDYSRIDQFAVQYNLQCGSDAKSGKLWTLCGSQFAKEFADSSKESQDLKLIINDSSNAALGHIGLEKISSTLGDDFEKKATELEEKLNGVEGLEALKAQWGYYLTLTEGNYMYTPEGQEEIKRVLQAYRHFQWAAYASLPNEVWTINGRQKAYDDYKTSKQKADAASINAAASQKSYNDQQVSINAAVTRWEELEKLRSEQVKQIAKRLCEKATDIKVLDATDHVGWARLLFIWIATSIEYSDAVKDDEKLKVSCSPADTIYRRKQVCEGFAALFNAMYNAAFETRMVPAGYEAVSVGGYAKTTRGRKYTFNFADNKGKADAAHAWNAFSYLDCTKNPPMRSYKLIDTCWGASAKGLSGLAATWFTKSNAAFLRSHVQYLGPGHSVKYTPEFRGGVPGTECVTTEARVAEILLRDAPIVRDSTYRECVRFDELSLQPNRYIVPPAQSQVFRFERPCACAPQRLEPKLFILACKDGEVNSFANIALFKKSAGNPSAYEATLDLSKLPKDGSVKLSIVAPFADKPFGQASETLFGTPDYPRRLPTGDVDVGVLQKYVKDGKVILAELVQWQLGGQ